MNALLFRIPVVADVGWNTNFADFESLKNGTLGGRKKQSGNSNANVKKVDDVIKELKAQESNG